MGPELFPDVVPEVGFFPSVDRWRRITRALVGPNRWQPYLLSSSESHSFQRYFHGRLVFSLSPSIPLAPQLSPPTAVSAMVHVINYLRSYRYPAGAERDASEGGHTAGCACSLTRAADVTQRDCGGLVVA